MKSPGLSAAIVITLALGIGANTAIFSMVYNVLLKPLPYPEADRLAVIWCYDAKGDSALISGAELAYWQEHATAFESIGAWGSRSLTWHTPSGARPLIDIPATPEYFASVGVKPIIGRLFNANEAGIAPKSGGAVVISNKFWKQQLGGDPNVLGRIMTLEKASYSIIGVMPEGYRVIAAEPDIWTPLIVDGQERAFHYLYVIARLRRGKSIRDAAAEMSVLGRQLAEAYPDSNKGWTAVPLLVGDWLVQGSVRRTLWTLLAAIGSVLLMACMNIANLLLSRAAARVREMSVRIALGASAGRLAGQLLTEALLYSLLGGAGGLLLAWWLIKIGPSLIPPGMLPAGAKVTLSAPVLLFTLGAAVVTGLLFGLAPVGVRYANDLTAGLKESNRGSSGGRGGARFRSVLLIVEVALAIVVIVASSLMVQTVIHLQNSDFGFRPEHVLTAWMPVPQARFASSEPLVDYFHAVLDRVRVLPGVVAADISTNVPMQPFIMRISFDHEGSPAADPNQRPTVNYQMIGPQYLQVFGIPIVSGRNLRDTDNAQSPPVALINSAFARSYFSGENPLGKRVVLSPPLWREDKFGPRTAIEIVGVTGDTHVASLSGAHYNFAPGTPVPEMYVPFAQNQWSGMKVLVARTAGDPSQLAQAVRAAILGADKDQNIMLIASMETMLYQRAATPRFRARLMGAFSGLAMLLAGVGVYSLTSFSVAQRNREFGIRLALGADGASILRCALQPILLLTAVGIAAGLLGAFAASKLISTFLYGVSATDPLTVGVAVVGFMTAALLAGWAPAWHAARIDPVQTLHQE